MAAQRTDTEREGAGLLLVILGAVLLVILYSCGDDRAGDRAGDRGGTASSTPSGALADAPAAAVAATSIGETGVTGVSGTLVAGKDIVLPGVSAALTGPNGDLSAYAGREAVATSVPVASVPADEGFWIGYGVVDRVWVELTGAPSESPYDVDSGDLVSFKGKMVKNAKGFSKRSGVTDAEGRTQLDRQGQHVAVDKGALRLDNR